MELRVTFQALALFERFASGVSDSRWSNDAVEIWGEGITTIASLALPQSVVERLTQRVDLYAYVLAIEIIARVALGADTVVESTALHIQPV